MKLPEINTVYIVAATVAFLIMVGAVVVFVVKRAIDPPPPSITSPPSAYVPTHHLRWNGGTLEVLYVAPETPRNDVIANVAKGEWRPVPQKGHQ